MDTIHNESSNEQSDIDTKSLGNKQPSKMPTQLDLHLSDIEEKYDG